MKISEGQCQSGQIREGKINLGLSGFRVSGSLYYAYNVVSAAHTVHETIIQPHCDSYLMDTLAS